MDQTDFLKYISFTKNDIKKISPELILSRRNLYQIYGDVLDGKTNINIINSINENKLDWTHPIYDKLHSDVEERNEFILNPFKIEEGVFECYHCGSKKTFSISKQTRSGDEATTVFVRCAEIKCNKSWTTQ